MEAVTRLSRATIPDVRLVDEAYERKRIRMGSNIDDGDQLSAKKRKKRDKHGEQEVKQLK